MNINPDDPGGTNIFTVKMDKEYQLMTYMERKKEMQGKQINPEIQRKYFKDLEDFNA